MKDGARSEIPARRDDERPTVPLREVHGNADGAIEIDRLGDEPVVVVLVARPVDLRALDHQEEAVLVSREDLEGLLRELGEGRVARPDGRRLLRRPA